jgi:hypothetical protein
MQPTKRHRKSMTDKREEIYGRCRLRLWRYAPAYIFCICCALPDMKASIPNIRAYDMTWLLVEVVKTHSYRSGCWFVSSRQSQL